MATYSKETALYDTGAIATDIAGAGQTATKYITKIDNAGIKVHPYNDSTSAADTKNYAQINASGLEVFENVSGTSTSVASFGTTARVGRSNSSRFLTNADSLQAYNSSNSKYFEVSASGMTYGSNTVASTTYADNKASAAQTAAVTAAASDATTKANNAAKTATNYITSIDSNKGITLKPSDSTGNDYLMMNSNAIAFYRNSDSNSCMNLTDDTFRVGLLASGHSTVKSDGLHVWTGAESTASNEVAVFGSTVRIGAASAQRVTTTSLGVEMYDKNDVRRIRLNDSGLHIDNGSNSVAWFGSSVRVGQSEDSRVEISSSNGMNVYDSNNKIRTNISSTGVSIFDTDGSTNIAQFASTARVGPTSSYNVYIDTTGVAFRSGTTDKMKITTAISGNYVNTDLTSKTSYSQSRLQTAVANNSSASGHAVAQLDASSTSGGDPSGTITAMRSSTEGFASVTAHYSSTVRAYLSLDAVSGSATAALGASGGISLLGDTTISGSLKVLNHSSAIGTIKDNHLSAAKSLQNNTAASLCSVSLEAGTWIVIGWVRFPSNGTGSRAANISTTSGAADWQVSMAAINGNISQLLVTRIISVGTSSSPATYHLNAVQTSGGALSLSAGNDNGINSIRAVRIA